MSGFSRGDLKRTVVSGLTTETSVIAAPGEGKRWLIMGGWLSGEEDATVELESGTTDVAGVFALGAGVPLTLPITGLPYLEGGENEALNITASSAVNGVLVYVVVDA